MDNHNLGCCNIPQKLYEGATSNTIVNMGGKRHYDTDSQIYPRKLEAITTLQTNLSFRWYFLGYGNFTSMDLQHLMLKL